MMRSAKLHADLAVIASEVEILSETRYAFRGELRDTQRAPAVAVSETGQRMTWDRDEPRLLAFVESELYQRSYRRPPDGIGRSVVMGGADHAFIHRLSEANSGVGTWEPGWTVVGVSDEQLVGVCKDIVCWVPASEVRAAGGELQPGVRCRVKVAKEVRHLVLGYYLALGNAAPLDQPPDHQRTIRLYWNLTPEGAVRYIELATTLLNDRGVPFRTKVIAHSELYYNADAGVLYLASDDFPRARTVISQLHRALAAELRPTTPMFTKPLAPGLGLAEDPLDGLSFGQARCRLVARGLQEAHVRGARNADDRLQAIIACFERAGLDPARPYLRSRSEDVYSLDALGERAIEYTYNTKTA